MRTSLSVSQLAVALLSLTPVISASAAWPRWFPEMDALVARQDDAGITSATPSETPAPESEEPSPTKKTLQTTNFNTAGQTPSGEPDESGSGSPSKTTGKAKTTKPPKKTEYPPQDPPGGVKMTKPSVFEGSQLYKIGGDPITWGWNYTNLQGTPTAIDVLITCATAKRTWTLTQNMTFAPQQTFKWDTKKYKEDHPKDALLTELYSLIVYDADGAFNDPPAPGYLAPFSGFQFGLYEPQEYVSFEDGWQCATCSGALSEVERRAVGGALAMSVITVLSFTWFVVGFGGGLP